jgi:hypothetical protein
MSEETKKPTSVISLAQAKSAAKAARATQATNTPAAMNALAETSVHMLDLRMDAQAAKEELSPQLYAVNSADKTIALVSDATVLNLIYEMSPRLTSRERAEVLSYVRRQVATTPERCIDFEQLVTALAFNDQLDVLAFKRIARPSSEASDISLERDLPEFKHVIELTNDPMTIILWIGSLLDHHSSRIQYLHWHGGGGNGKSTVFDAISEVLGPSFVVDTRAADFMGPHWGMQVAGARVLVFRDDNSTTLFSSGKFKEFTGESYATVNPKNKPHQRIRLTHKTAVLSNKNVSISGDAADRRRLLPVSSKPDTEPEDKAKWWYEGLRSKGELMLMYCYSKYRKAVEADPSIRVYIPADKKLQTAAVEERYGDTLAVLESFLEFKIGDPLNPSVLIADIYKRYAEVSGQKIDLNTRKQIAEALEFVGVKKYVSNKGRAFGPCKMRGLS